MKTPQAGVTNHSALPEPARPAAGKSTRSDGLPASGRADPVQLTPGFTAVAHEDPFGAHLLGEQVQMRGKDVGTSEHVHAAAAHGIAGAGATLPFLDQIQASFGPAHDVSHVQAHVGGAAAEASSAMGALAYATGDHVAFAGRPDLHTAAHEAAHVVQQQSGVQLAGGVGASGDSYERHADQVADSVVRGESAAELLGSTVASGRSSNAVQRFGADEHQMLGNDGSGDSMVELAPGYSLPFGDVVALAGDHFESIAQMRWFARNVNGGKESRAEIEWARIWKLTETKGPVDARAWHDLEARESQEKRYYQLAGRNQSHFLAPREKDRGATPAETSGVGNDRGELAAARYTNRLPKNAPEGYRLNHIRAIFEAVEAARATSGAAAGEKDVPTLGSALATEAFGCHFLTDSFAGGHVRTARQDLKSHWDPKVPMFFFNLVGLMGDLIAGDLQKRGAYGTFSQHFLADSARGTVNDELQKKASFTIGDLIAGALHHQDNVHGVHVQAGGADAHLVGDGELGRGTAAAQQTANLATRAVRLGVHEIRQAHALGRLPEMTPIEVIEGFLASHDGRFGAETLVPDASTIDESKSPESKWRVDSIEELLSDGVFLSGAKIFFQEQAGELKAMAKDLGGAQGDALTHGVVDQLVADPIGLLRRAINWTPGSGHAHSWESKNDSSDYVDEAKRRHALETLTLEQRISLMKSLTEGLMPEVDSDGRRNVERGHPDGARNRPALTMLTLLETASVRDSAMIIDAVGYDSIVRWLTPELKLVFAAKYPTKAHAAR